jgi:hypothetical protein
MHANRGASAEGRPYTTRFRADTTDRLRGDTGIARFDTTASGDSASRARLRELVARGTAKSYYHMAAADTAVHRPAINYVTGREITVFFEQKVSRVTVIDRAAGVYLEPKPVAVRPPADTARSTPPPRPRP